MPELNNSNMMATFQRGFPSRESKRTSVVSESVYGVRREAVIENTYDIDMQIQPAFEDLKKIMADALVGM